MDDFDRLLEDTGTDILDITKPIAKKAAEIRACYRSFFNNRDDRFVERVYSFANEEKGYRENEGIEL